MNMYNPFNTTACTSQSQRMNEAQQHLIKAFVRLIAKKDGRKQRWAGTKTDLLEMAHLAYTFSSVRDEQGRPATFLWMARHVCTNFHLSIPRNPNALVFRSTQRKNAKRAPLLERYCYLLFEKGIEQPLQAWLAV